ncbi:hypothetical protein [Zooshikella harenae]|uniref:Uncharacterized protein n=1 Tax=Zooshikella harenae TaxID=2827238 RepID=A0ABS5ZJJ8_9GAMM|nr:hypothetical protein [Zooshikella harenae]MBU2714261.1 hypothetical protein [Zooshikella harenae]
MKALSIVALVFSALSIFIPVGGVFIAMLCSLMAIIAFRSQPTLSGVTFGINIINTAFLSPSIMISDAASSGALDLGTTTTSAPTEAGSIYWFYVGFHVVLFIAAIVWRLTRGAPKQNIEQSAPQT